MLAGGGAEALRLLAGGEFDVVFMDVRMPDLDGLELAKALQRFANPPALVFVSAFEDGAVSVFEHGLQPLDFLMKPVSRARIEQALERVRRATPSAAAVLRAQRAGSREKVEQIIPVEHQRGGATRLLDRSSDALRPGRGRLCAHLRRQWPLPDAHRSLRYRAALGRARFRAGAPQLRREPAAGGRDPAAARWHGDDRDGRWQRGARRAPSGRGPAPEAADVSPSPPGRRSRDQSPNPPGRRRLPRRGVRPPREELAEATAHGHVYLRGLQRTQLTLSLLALVAFGAVFGVLPIALYLLPCVRQGCACWASRSAFGSWSCRCCPSSS